MVLGSQTASALNLQAISPAPSLEQSTMIPPPKGWDNFQFITQSLIYGNSTWSQQLYSQCFFLTMGIEIVQIFINLVRPFCLALKFDLKWYWLHILYLWLNKIIFWCKVIIESTFLLVKSSSPPTPPPATSNTVLTISHITSAINSKTFLVFYTEISGLPDPKQPPETGCYSVRTVLPFLFPMPTLRALVLVILWILTSN